MSESKTLEEQFDELSKLAIELSAEKTKLETELAEARAGTSVTCPKCGAIHGLRNCICTVCGEPLHGEYEALKRELGEAQETHGIQLAAISTAAMCNTRESAKLQRIDRDSPYWTPAYSDVVTTIEREMSLREELTTLRADYEHVSSILDDARSVNRELLDKLTTLRGAVDKLQTPTAPQVPRPHDGTEDPNQE
jgi:DNA repair exonuclease SbcCD ATPase subunit